MAGSEATASTAPAGSSTRSACVQGKRRAFLAGFAEADRQLLLALGLLTPLASAALIAVMVVAILTVHAKNGVWNSSQGYEFNLVLISIAVASIGAGNWSLDDALGLDIAGADEAIASLGAGLLGGLGAITSRPLASATPAEAAAAA